MLWFARKKPYQDTSQWKVLRCTELRSLFGTDVQMSIHGGQQQGCESTGNAKNLPVPQFRARPMLKNKSIVDAGLLPSVKIPTVQVQV